MSSTSSIERAKAIAQKTLDGEYDLLLACRDICDIPDELPGVRQDVMNTFIGIASEMDGVPIGPERVHWSTEALKLKDAQAADYRQRVKEVVMEALKELLVSLGGTKRTFH